jgi:L-asparaginase/Glu-tRNA(Gln) amidotransferase subunit D
MTVITMGATMFLTVENDGKGPAVRDSDAEDRVVSQAVRTAVDAKRRIEGLPPASDALVAAACPRFVRMAERSGAELTLKTVFEAVELVRHSRPPPPRTDAADQAPQVNPVVIVTGTDALEEFALACDWLLAEHLPPNGGGSLLAVVVTGAMRPASALCPDGARNLSDAILAAWAAAERADAANAGGGGRPRRPGVLVTMGGLLHSARHVRKSCSVGDGGFAFSSGPCAGPVGAVRSDGRVTWSHPAQAPPPPSRLPGLLPGGIGVAAAGACSNCHDLPRLSAAIFGNAPPSGAPFSDALCLDHLRGFVDVDVDLRTRVAIWTLTCDALPPPKALLLADDYEARLDGLVLAAPGAGSVAASVLAAVSAPEVRARGLPIVLVSRCGAGPSHDRGLYGFETSVKKYTDARLILGGAGGGEGAVEGGEDDDLTPLQARLALSVALTLRETARRMTATWVARRARGDGA